jgi:hypothetical protein
VVAQGGTSISWPVRASCCLVPSRLGSGRVVWVRIGLGTLLGPEGAGVVLVPSGLDLGGSGLARCRVALIG